MYSSPATDDDLLRVTQACDTLRKHCDKLGVMQPGASFKGKIDDVLTLDYLEYRGLGLLREETEAVSLAWGNVLARRVGFRWHCSYRGDLVLVLGDPDAPRFEAAIWPSARVLEAQIGGAPQSGLFTWLTRRVIAERLEQSCNPEFVSALCRLKEQLGDET